MSRVEDDRLDDCDLELVFIAATTSEAESAEDFLTKAGIDYALDFEPFVRAGVFGSTSLVGVGFFVIPGHASLSRDLLREKGLGKGVVGEMPE